MDNTEDQKQPDPVVRSVKDSPPLTSSLFSRNSAASAEESAYLRLATLLRWARLALSLFSVVVSIVIVGCTGHVLFAYNQTHRPEDDYLFLWPFNVDVKPTLGTMIPSILVMITSLVYFLFAIVPSPHSRILYQVHLFLLTSSIAFASTLFAILFNQILLYKVDTNSRETLQTWTCKFYYGAKDFESGASASGITLSGDELIPVGFQRICLESMAGQWMTVGLLVVEIACFGVAMWGFVAERKIKKSRDMRYRGAKCESEFE